MPNKVQWNNVDFSTIEITSKKVRRNDVDFSPIKIMRKKVRRNGVDFLSIKIISKKVCRNDVDFLSIKISWKIVRRSDVDFSPIELHVMKNCQNVFGRIVFVFTLVQNVRLRFLKLYVKLVISIFLSIVVSFLSYNLVIKNRFSIKKHTLGGIWDTILWRSFLSSAWQSIEKSLVADRTWSSEKFFVLKNDTGIADRMSDVFHSKKSTIFLVSLKINILWIDSLK